VIINDPYKAEVLLADGKTALYEDIVSIEDQSNKDTVDQEQNVKMPTVENLDVIPKKRKKINQTVENEDVGETVIHVLVPKKPKKINKTVENQDVTETKVKKTTVVKKGPIVKRKCTVLKRTANTLHVKPAKKASIPLPECTKEIDKHVIVKDIIDDVLDLSTKDIKTLLCSLHIKLDLVHYAVESQHKHEASDPCKQDASDPCKQDASGTCKQDQPDPDHINLPEVVKCNPLVSSCVHVR
jgi:hypothetical protein